MTRVANPISIKFVWSTMTTDIDLTSNLGKVYYTCPPARPQSQVVSIADLTTASTVRRVCASGTSVLKEVN